MDTAELYRRVCAVVENHHLSLWEQIMELYVEDPEAFYELGCRNIEAETPETLHTIARRIKTLRRIIRESYSFEPGERGSVMVGSRGTTLLVPTHLVDRVREFAATVDGKTTGSLASHERLVGQKVSAAEVRFKLGDE